MDVSHSQLLFSQLLSRLKELGPLPLSAEDAESQKDIVSAIAAVVREVCVGDSKEAAAVAWVVTNVTNLVPQPEPIRLSALRAFSRANLRNPDTLMSFLECFSRGRDFSEQPGQGDSFVQAGELLSLRVLEQSTCSATLLDGLFGRGMYCENSRSFGDLFSHLSPTALRSIWKSRYEDRLTDYFLEVVPQMTVRNGGRDPFRELSGYLFAFLPIFLKGWEKHGSPGKRAAPKFLSPWLDAAPSLVIHAWQWCRKREAISGGMPPWMETSLSRALDEKPWQFLPGDRELFYSLVGRSLPLEA